MDSASVTGLGSTFCSVESRSMAEYQKRLELVHVICMLERQTEMFSYGLRVGVSVGFSVGEVVGFGVTG